MPSRMMREETNASGGSGSGSFPSAYLMAISQELAADSRRIFVPSASRSLAEEESLSGDTSHQSQH